MDENAGISLQNSQHVLPSDTFRLIIRSDFNHIDLASVCVCLAWEQEEKREHTSAL